METLVHSDALSRFGYALSDSTRTQILLSLRAGPGYPSELADKIGVSRQILSNHLACLRGCGGSLTALHLSPRFTLSFDVPRGSGFDAYMSDPARPVPYRVQPSLSPWAKGSTWPYWLVDDQRFAEGRHDVLTYSSEPLTAPLKLAGTPLVHLVASTSGTDSDWVVKLIDVYPATNPGKPFLAGYRLPIAMEVMRARYREDPASALVALRRPHTRTGSLA